MTILEEDAYHVTESGLDFRHGIRRQQRKEEDGDDDNTPLSSLRRSGGNDNNGPVPPAVFLEQFRNNFEIRILDHPSKYELVFELLNVDVSFVNALRRILLSEISTVAIEHVYMWDNTSIIHDEVLAHRIGLIPLNLDARLLDEPPKSTSLTAEHDDDHERDRRNMDHDDEDDEDEGPTDRNTVVFRLAVSCSNKDAKNKQRGGGGGGSSNKKSVIDVDDDDDETVASRATTTSVIGNHSGTIAPPRPSSDDTTTTTTMRPNRLQFPKDRPYTKHVYSKDIVWAPQGDQQERFARAAAAVATAAKKRQQQQQQQRNSRNNNDDNKMDVDLDDDDEKKKEEDANNNNTNVFVGPIHDDILIAKLRHGQTIELEAHARKGIGKDHAKYSPVCTACYRLMPKIEILQPIYDDDAYELVHIYEPGVFELISTDIINDNDPPHTKMKVRLINPYACTMSRNYMRNSNLAQSLRITRIPNHFIMNIESVGQYTPGVLLAEALRVLQSKCNTLIQHIDEYNKNDIKQQQQSRNQNGNNNNNRNNRRYNNSNNNNNKNRNPRQQQQQHPKQGSQQRKHYNRK